MSVSQILINAAIAGVTVHAAKTMRDAAASTVRAPSAGVKATVDAVNKQWKAGAGRTLVTASQDLRVEPYVLLEESVSRLPYVKDILEANLRLFTSYYLLSVAADNQIGGVTVQKRIGKFAPDRDLMAATQDFLSVESYQFGLPFANEVTGVEAYNVYAPESANPTFGENSNESNVEMKDVQKTVMEIANMSIGQIVTLTINAENGSKANIPVMVRLRVIGASSKAVTNVFGYGFEDNSKATRLRRFRVGDLSLKNLITNQDRIDAYRRAAFNDNSGFFRKVHNRQNRGMLASALTSEPSIGAISSIAIISYRTQRELERMHFGNFDDFSRRQSMFVDSLLMMMAVVDDENDTVTCYTRDIEDKQVYTLSDIQKSAKANNNDLTDLLKAFMSGSVPGRL